MNDGATPKDTTSHNESNSEPNSLAALISRAVKPSNISKTAASNIKSDALINKPSDA